MGDFRGFESAAEKTETLSANSAVKNRKLNKTVRGVFIKRIMLLVVVGCLAGSSAGTFNSCAQGFCFFLPGGGSTLVVPFGSVITRVPSGVIITRVPSGSLLVRTAGIRCFP